MEPSSKRRFSARAVVISGIVFIVLLCIPAVIIGVYYRTSDAIKTQVYAQQTTLAQLVAQAIKIKLDGLVSIASSMASSSTLVSATANKQWLVAADAARDMQNNEDYYDPFIDRMIIYDPQGIQQAAYPALVGGLGTSATSSSWYGALSSGGASSYVTHVSLRLSLPQIHVVSVAVPIRSGTGNAVGFLVLQIPAEHFLEFGGNVSLGTYGFAYIVDPAGNLVIHPKYSADNGGVINYSFDPAVQNAIRGEKGTMIIDQGSGAKGIVTFAPVPSYGWGVIEQQLYEEAFAGNTGILFDIGLLAALAALADVLVVYVLFRILNNKEVQA